MLPVGKSELVTTGCRLAHLCWVYNVQRRLRDCVSGLSKSSQFPASWTTMATIKMIQKGKSCAFVSLHTFAKA